MGKHETIAVFDYDRKKLCDLYDSQNDLVGQAYDIVVSTDFSGEHTLEFKIPYIVDANLDIEDSDAAKYGTAKYGISRYSIGSSRKRNFNFRWEFLRSDFVIRYTKGNKKIWFIANKPQKSKSGKKIYGSVTCSGSESLLKTRSIYKTFDDENGIGTIDYLIKQVLTGTGWQYDEDHSDTIYENDGRTEKIRSLNTDNKKGAIDLINTICNLFQARPIYDTDKKTVSIKSIKNRQQVLEGVVGRNLNALTVKHDSSDIATRVYIEGEYGDYGYVGIDDVEVDGEPWGLPFLMNFDYYRELGVFKPSHEEALATYLTDIRAKKAEIRAAGALLTACEDEINNMIGQCSFALYYKSSGYITPAYTFGTLTPEQSALNMDDPVVVLKDNGSIEYTTWIGNPAQTMGGAYGVVKFVTKAAGQVAAAEVQIEAKNKEIEKLRRKINVLVPGDEKIAEYEKEIVRIQCEMDAIFTGYQPYSNVKGYAVGDNCSHNVGGYGESYSYLITRAYECNTAIPPQDAHDWNGNEWDECDFGGLFKMMHDIMNPSGLMYELSRLEEQIVQLNIEQDEIEATFISAMGYMLRDGYWSNNNYVIGQEEFLYADGLDMTKQMSRPTTDYTFDYVRITEDFDVDAEDIEINAVFKLYDPELQVDDKMFIRNVSYGVDNKALGKITVSNQDITMTGNDLGSLLSRMSQLADLIEQKNTMYERAKALSEDGTLYADRLNGQIEIMRTQILSSVSNWYTDENGSIVFLSADGNSAMMLSGAGMMLASGKTDTGDWDWRSCLDGHGMTADEIVTGFLSADRIEAGSITTSKLASEVGSNLNLSSNTSINAKIETAISDAESAINNNVEMKIAEAQLTDSEFAVMFGRTVGPGINDSIDSVQTDLNNYQQGVSNYMRYDDTGTLTLGKTDNNFQTQLTNTKMSFMEGNSEVSYISNQSMFITTARVTDALSLGTNNGYGYFDWTVTPTGLGLKWRNPGFGGIKVTMKFVGISTVPSDFKITNNYNDTVFTAQNASAGDGINTAFEWTISGIVERTAITFTQANVDVSGYTRSGSELVITSDTVLTDITITTPFTNIYTADA